LELWKVRLLIKPHRYQDRPAEWIEIGQTASPPGSTET
jgi:hypothetical protein